MSNLTIIQKLNNIMSPNTGDFTASELDGLAQEMAHALFYENVLSIPNMYGYRRNRPKRVSGNQPGMLENAGC